MKEEKIYSICWWNHGYYLGYVNENLVGYRHLPYRGATSQVTKFIEIIGNIYENPDLLS